MPLSLFLPFLSAKTWVSRITAEDWSLGDHICLECPASSERSGIFLNTLMKRCKQEGIPVLLPMPQVSLILHYFLFMNGELMSPFEGGLSIREM